MSVIVANGKAEQKKNEKPKKTKSEGEKESK